MRLLSPRHARLIAALLLSALMPRALVPVGFMPGSHAGAGITLELCTAQGLEKTVVDHDGNSPPVAPGSLRESPCVYAATATIAPPPTLPAIQSPASHVDLAVVSADFVPPARPLARAHGARAPPLRA